MKGSTREDEQFQNQDMEFDRIAKFVQGKTILVTGATGFLSKVFVEKILRLQPKVNKLYLLLRAQDEESALQRLIDEIINTELFKVLRRKWGSEFNHSVLSKIVAVAGDISFENLGVKDFMLRQKMWNEIEIIVNVAATTDFYERYDVALDINTFGVLNVLNFGKKCDKVKLFLHVSTVYVCGEQTGIILEKRFYMGETLKETSNLNIIEERRNAEEKLDQLRHQSLSDEALTIEMKEFGLKRAKLNGWPNTYVFTKAMGEMLLGKFKGEFPLVIVRPSMITSTYKQPFPGWIEGLRTIDIVIMGYGKGELTCFPGNLNSALDVEMKTMRQIPVDMVVNAMVVAMEVHYANHQYSREIIYHVSSSLQNPMKYSDIQKFAYCYFTKNPWVDRNGRSVKIGELTVISRTDLFFLSMQLKYVLPLKVFYLINIFCCQRFKKVHTKLDRQIKFVMRLAQLYKPYAFFTGIFDVRNLDKLEKVARERGIDGAEFDFNSRNIDWEDYIINIHIPGLLKHAIRS
ncbi:hypothetical protein V6N13_039416 [Hibiscus sabdariffa]|uniref:Fatty acyl-CoA reductase n=1 Tax=Hibiscus sabdariffa TaxID=183260 RepID=A0ABR2SW51_9ROSI